METHKADHQLLLLTQNFLNQLEVLTSETSFRTTQRRHAGIYTDSVSGGDLDEKIEIMYVMYVKYKTTAG